VTARSTTALFAILIVGLAPQTRKHTQAQSPQPGQSTQPSAVFRSRADAVSVTVFVSDSDGKPVRGLTVDDFELLENGKPREMTTFEEVNLPLPPVRETLTGVESDVRTNEDPPGRVYIFALSVNDQCMALKTRFLIKEFMTRYFGPHDVATVIQLGRGLRTDGQEFTNSLRLIMQAVEKYSGGFGGCADSPRPTGQVRAEDFRDLIEVVAAMEGRHKTLLYFSEGPMFDWLDVIDYRGGVRSYDFDVARAALSLATRANLTIYPIDPRGLTVEMGELESRMLFRAMGRATGGFATINTNTFTQSFERIAIDSSSFYGLGFNSGYEKDDGRFVNVTVTVKRPGLTVRTREGYVPLTEKQRADQARRTRPPTDGVLGALANPAATHAGIPLRVHAAAFRRPNKLVEVALTIETDASAMAFTETNGAFTGQIDVRHLASDARKRIFPEIRGRGNITLQPAAYARAMEHGMRFVSVFDFPPGRYQLRIASASDNRTGSVVYDLEVPDFREDAIMLSGLALTTADAALAPTALVVTRDEQKPANCRNNVCVAPKVMNSPWLTYGAVVPPPSRHTLATALPGPPTTARQFAPSDVLTLYAEAYDNRTPKTRAGSGAMVVTTTIYDAQHAVAHRTVAEQAEPAVASGDLTYPIQRSIPLSGLERGGYVLEIAVTPYGEIEPAASRSVPFRIQ